MTVLISGTLTGYLMSKNQKIQKKFRIGASVLWFCLLVGYSLLFVLSLILKLKCNVKMKANDLKGQNSLKSKYIPR